MSTKLSFLASFVFVLGLVNIAPSAIVYWIDTDIEPVSNLWTDANNWLNEATKTNTMPGPQDDAYHYISGWVDPNFIIGPILVQDGMNVECGSLRVGLYQPANVNDVNSVDKIFNTPVGLTITGGELRIHKVSWSDGFRIGCHGGYGHVVMTGGSVLGDLGASMQIGGWPGNQWEGGCLEMSGDSRIELVRMLSAPYGNGIAVITMTDNAYIGCENWKVLSPRAVYDLYDNAKIELQGAVRAERIEMMTKPLGEPRHKDFLGLILSHGHPHGTVVDGVRYMVHVEAKMNSPFILPILGNQLGTSTVTVKVSKLRANATYKPSPEDGADVPIPVNGIITLSWSPGETVATHLVYFADNLNDVNDRQAGALLSTQSVGDEDANTPPLKLNTQYFWAVDEQDSTGFVMPGDVWSFTTSDHIVVDDFESYNDLDTTDPASNRIFNVWIDGYGVPTNGSIVGYENPPFTEQTIVHGGRQSMPLSYSNTDGAAYSEAERTFVTPQNWTESGVKTLAIFFYGTAGNTGQMYVKIDSSKVVYGGDAGDIAKSQWNRWNIDLASVGVNLQRITKLAVGIDGNGASGKLYFDDIRLY